MRRACPSLLLLVSVACGGGSRAPGTPTGGEPPADVLSRHAGGLRPVIFEHGVPYLWLALVDRSGEPPVDGPELPDCIVDDLDCWKTLPAPADQLATFGPLPTTVTVVTPDGTCTAKVEPAVVVNTSGCEPAMTYGAPLTGCGAALAPVAFTAAEVAAELRWLPAPPVKMAPLPADLTAIADPVQRRYLEGWLTSSSLAGTRRDARTGVVAVDAGAEALTTVVAGALVGDSADECELAAADEQVLGLRRGDGFTELALTEGPEVDGYVARVTEWDGALAWRGRVVGVVSGSPRSVMVHAVGAGAAPTPLFDQTVWWDNEECTQGTWSGVEYPCGP